MTTAQPSDREAAVAPMDPIDRLLRDLHERIDRWYTVCDYLDHVCVPAEARVANQIQLETIRWLIGEVSEATRHYENDRAARQAGGLTL